MFDNLIDPPLQPSVGEEAGGDGGWGLYHTLQPFEMRGRGKGKGEGEFKAARSMRTNCNCGYATEEGWHFGRRLHS
jgi:hypothetical protein